MPLVTAQSDPPPTTSTTGPEPPTSTTSTTSAPAPDAPVASAGFSSDPGLRASLAHLYRRAGFGASPAELDAAEARGYAASVELLLTGPDPAADAIPAPTLTQPPTQLPSGNNESNAITIWWLQRMIASTNPLREKLPWFWHGHLTSHVDDAGWPALMYAQNQLFRTYGGGNFQTLVRQVTTDPAMLQYLSLLYSHKNAPNENYARELCELFVLGRIDASGNQPYTENDVKAAARALTGWTTNGNITAIVFSANRWDPGSKTFLGQTGAWNTDDIIRTVTHDAAAARWIPTKAWSFFAYPVTPADQVVSDLTPGFAADLDITNLLRAVFNHPSFQSTQARTGRVKTPVEWMVQTMRTLELSPNDTTVNQLSALQQVPFRPPNVAGWPANGYWLSTAAALDRVRVAQSLATAGNTSPVDSAAPANRAAACATMLGVKAWTPRTATALDTVRNESKSLVAIALVSPEYTIN